MVEMWKNFSKIKFLNGIFWKRKYLCFMNECDEEDFFGEKFL